MPKITDHHGDFSKWLDKCWLNMTQQGLMCFLKGQLRSVCIRSCVDISDRRRGLTFLLVSFGFAALKSSVVPLWTMCMQVFTPTKLFLLISFSCVHACEYYNQLLRAFIRMKICLIITHCFRAFHILQPPGIQYYFPFLCYGVKKKKTWRNPVFIVTPTSLLPHETNWQRWQHAGVRRADAQ